MKKFNGILYIVATPIGNLEDITLRALAILKEVDLIAAEDTSHSQYLLRKYNIATPCISLHKFNESKRTQYLIDQLQAGKNIALISDAGTPLISDPGYRLVAEVRQAAINIVPIPGACAAIAALSASGLPTDKFIFEGFLPASKSAQIKRLDELKNEERTLIFYEAPHRILQTIENLITVFGTERYAVIAKELTKIYEKIYGASLAELKNWLTSKPELQQGEFVILVHGAEIIAKEIDQESERILKILLDFMPTNQAAQIAAKITNNNKRDLYQAALRLKK